MANVTLLQCVAHCFLLKEAIGVKKDFQTTFIGRALGWTVVRYPYPGESIGSANGITDISCAWTPYGITVWLPQNVLLFKLKTQDLSARWL